MKLLAQIIKRLIDIIAALTALILLSPLLLWLGLVIRARLGSPIFFRQNRIGKNNRPFMLIKFRSMITGKGDDASRLTPFGAWLRATSFDELPELWNILRGDMSLVGPRPLLPEYLPYYTQREATRHQMRPGITGLAQVSGRNAISWDARLNLDAEYVETWNLALDIKIIIKTFMTVIRKEGITAEGHATMMALNEARKETHHATH
jgi:sugar transferase EpsL